MWLFFLVLFLIILLAILAYVALECSNWDPNASGCSTRTTYMTEPKRKPVVRLCECAASSGYSHMGQINHKIRCRRLRELNPNLSWTDFMDSEGFPNEPGNWPPVSP